MMLQKKIEQMYWYTAAKAFNKNKLKGVPDRVSKETIPLKKKEKIHFKNA